MIIIVTMTSTTIAMMIMMIHKGNDDPCEPFDDVSMHTYVDWTSLGSR
jgi:hypothetical protein